MLYRILYSVIVTITIVASSTSGCTPAEEVDTIPKEIVPLTADAGQIYVEIENLYGDKFLFLVDTGFELSSFSRDSIPRFKPNARFNPLDIGGAAGARNAQAVRDVHFKLGSRLIRLPNVGVLAALPRTARSYDGILGFDFFKQFVVEINLKDNSLVTHLLESFRYDGEGLEYKMVDMGATLPAITVSVRVGSNHLEGPYIVDTGSNREVVIFSHRIAAIEQHYSGESSRASGLGDTRLKRLNTQGVTIGSMVLNDATVYALDTSTAEHIKRLNAFGLIGCPIWKDATLIFDLARKRLIVEK